MLDGSFHRTGTKFRIISDLCQELYSSICQYQFHTILGQHLLYTFYLEYYNLLDFAFIQWQEHDCLINTV